MAVFTDYEVSNLAEMSKRACNVLDHKFNCKQEVQTITAGNLIIFGNQNEIYGYCVCMFVLKKRCL